MTNLTSLILRTPSFEPREKTLETLSRMNFLSELHLLVSMLQDKPDFDWSSVSCLRGLYVEKPIDSQTLSRLKRLHLCATSLVPQLPLLTNLRRLELSVTQEPDHVISLESLTKLTKLVCWTPNEMRIKLPPSMESLIVGYGAEIIAEAAKLQELTSLVVYELPRATYAPEDFFQLKNLTTLTRLEVCHITRSFYENFAENFKYFTNLTSLSLSGSLRISEALQLPKLKFLEHNTERLKKEFLELGILEILKEPLTFGEEDDF